MQSHVQRTVSRCFTVLRQLRTIRRQIPTAVFQSLIVALVLSRLDYCNSVLFGLPANLITRLQSVQNRSLQHGSSSESDDQNILLPRSSAFTGCASQSAISFILAVLTYRSIHVTSRSYLQSCFTRVANMTPRRRLWSSASHSLQVLSQRLGEPVYCR